MAPPLSPPADPQATDDALLERFLAYVAELGVTLYPAQEEAILELCSGSHVILDTPTGSGKSLVALAAHYFALCRGQRSVYTAPIKALANEKFFALVAAFGAENVGLLTGDTTVNRDAPVLVCTAEVLSNMALSEGARTPVDVVVMDEFHYYADRDRGAAWQVPLLTLPRTSFLLMSATFGDTAPFERALAKLGSGAVATVTSRDRPVPLDFRYAETPIHETVHDLVASGRAPIYLVSFTQRGAAELAQNLLSVDYATKDEKRAIADALVGIRFDSPYGKEMQRFVRHGIGLHHAGLLPKYRLLVEKLAQRGLLKIISGTDTLGVGVNIPIRTVVLTQLCKYDGSKTALLTARDFHQVAGRAGRKGFDDQGSVVCQAPEHVIENLRLEAKAGGDAKKLRKLVRKKPPERGYVPWDKAAFERIVAARPEALTSRFTLTHGMLLELLSREEDGGCMAVARLVKASHERDAQKRIIGREALEMTKTLLDCAVLTRERDSAGRPRFVVSDDLQLEFALHQSLGLWLIDAVGRLMPDDPLYALDVLTCVESILESPEPILRQQVAKLKAEKVAEMKAAGVEYDERMAELDKIEHPKPNAELIYGSYNEFVVRHPWAKREPIRPKSIARDMIELAASFSDYVKEYGLARVEGLLLRYLSDVYKALVQTVPDWAKNEALEELTVDLGAVVKQVDSSLLDEWERMRDPQALFEVRAEGGAVAEPAGSADVTKDARAFRALVRNEAFTWVRLFARGELAALAERLSDPWTEEVLARSLASFRREHGDVRCDAEARSPSHLALVTDGGRMTFRQEILDEEGPTGFAFAGSVDLARSRDEARAVLALERWDEPGP